MSSAAACPQCGHSIEADFGILNCPGCGITLMVGMDGSIVKNDPPEELDSTSHRDSLSEEDRSDSYSTESTLPTAESSFSSDLWSDAALPEETQSEESQPQETENSEPIIEASEKTMQSEESLDVVMSDLSDQSAFVTEDKIEVSTPREDVLVPEPPSDPKYKLFQVTEQTPALSYQLHFFDIDTSDARRTLMQILNLPALGLEIIPDFDQVVSGELHLGGLTAAQTHFILSRTQDLGLKIRWDQELYADNQ